MLIEEIMKYIEYDPNNTRNPFIWKKRPKSHPNDSFNEKYAGCSVGCIDNSKYGYISFNVMGKQVYVHRLVYALNNGITHYDDIPIVDHIDGDSSNNSPSNLRNGDDGLNQRNRKGFGTSCYKGVDYSKAKKFRSRIVINRREIHLGTFEDPVTAARAYDAASKYCGYDSMNFNDDCDYKLDSKTLTRLDVAMNSRKVLKLKSNLLGVNWNTKQQKYNATVYTKDAHYCAGSFTDPLLAASARNEFILTNNLNCILSVVGPELTLLTLNGKHKVAIK